MNSKASLMLVVILLLAGCQSIPEWDKQMKDSPVEDGRCPDLTGRFNYEHLGANDTRGKDSILGDTLTSELPRDRSVPNAFNESGRIFMKIYKGKYFDPYPGAVIATLTRLDQLGRAYHVRVDSTLEGLLGEFDFKIERAWTCNSGSLLKTEKTTIHERPNPDEIDPKDYRRIYVLPNGNIRIDRKHTYICGWNPKGCFARYYESRVFAKIP